jgi:hypothetical protein
MPNAEPTQVSPHHSGAARDGLPTGRSSEFARLLQSTECLSAAPGGYGHGSHGQAACNGLCRLLRSVRVLIDADSAGLTIAPTAQAD